MSDHGDSGIGDSKCYCSNLLSLLDGGSTTEWPGQRRVRHVVVPGQFSS